MVKTVLLLLICIGLFQPVKAQRLPFIFTPSPRLLESEIVAPYFMDLQKISIPVYRIEIVDNRYDINKIGFHPEMKKAPREVRLSSPLSELIRQVFEKGVELNDSSDRKLIVVIQQCWISYYAESHFSILKKTLLAGLEYKIEFFTALDSNYYPLKRLSGNLESIYGEETTSRYLIDSMIHIIQLEIPKFKFGEREDTASAITATRMDSYITEKKSVIPKRYTYGMYPTFEDFLQQRSITDSIDIIPYKDYYDRDVIAANLGIVKNGLVEPCSKYWGYFDGRYLFYNTGNGYFIRLFPVNGQFVLADLQQMALSAKKRSVTSESHIGKTSYAIIKEYGKAYHLFFQLNYDDGKLY